MLKTGQILDIEEASILPLPTFNDTDAFDIEDKGWNLPNIWDLKLLKKVYQLIVKLEYKTKQNLYKELKNQVRTGLRNPERLIDEYWNALICFEIIDYNKPEFVILKNDFFDSENDALSGFDIFQLEKIYFNYYRFKEISNWFLKNNTIKKSDLYLINEETLKDHSYPIFCTSFHDIIDKEERKKRHLTDTIFYDENPSNIYQLAINENKLMRFFDVFTNWGQKINRLQSINLTDGINITCKNKNKRKIKVYYFINDHNSFDIKDIIDLYYKNSGRIISLPELTINIALKYKCSIEMIHKEIIKQTSKYNGLYSLQRTSKIFISKERDSEVYMRDREKLYPKLGNAFISHIIIR